MSDCQHEARYGRRSPPRRCVTFVSIAQQASTSSPTRWPWLVRLEQAIGRAMFANGADHAEDAYARFNVDALLWGDSKTRADVLATGVQNGWYSVNDVRSILDLAPVDGGDTYMQPLNLGPLNALGKLPKGDA